MMETHSCIPKIEEELSRPPIFTTVRVNTRFISTEDAVEKLQQCILQQYQDRDESPPVVIAHPVLTDVLVIAGQGGIQRQKCEKMVIVDHCCGCAVLRGAHVFTTGILGAPSHMQAGDRVSVYADLDARCLMGRTQAYTGRTMHVGNGIAMYSRNDVFVSKEKPRGVGIRMTAPLFDCPSLSGLLPDLVFPQNLPSAVVGHVLDPSPGDVVLDMCAAPGGKTTHIATLMKDTGRVVALDRSSKIKKITENCKVWGITIVSSYSFDATRCIEIGADMVGSPPYPPESFDRVLLDGPCSALGQRPMLVNDMSAKHLASHPAVQKALFKQAVSALKPGGCLVYSTCTLPIAENEGVVVWALATFPQLQLVVQVPHLGGPGVTIPGLSEDQAQMLQRFGPAKLIKHDCEDEQLINMFKKTENETRLGGSKIIDRTDDPTCFADSDRINDKEDITHTNVNEDTIGFFIAKFLKR